MTTSLAEAPIYRAEADETESGLLSSRSFFEVIYMMVESGRSFPESYQKRAVNFEVLTPYEFLSDFGLEASKAKSHISTQALLVEPDEFGYDLFEVYKQVPPTVKKQLNADYFTLLSTNGLFNALNEKIPWYKKQIEENRKGKRELFTKFAEADIEINFLNPPKGPLVKYFPTMGRNHLKGVSIDDDTFYFGGLSYTVESRERADFMVKFKGEMAQKLTEQLGNINSKESFDDYKMQLSEDTWLVVDGGKSGRSLIVDEAIDLVDHSRKSVYTTSYLFPDGKFSEACSAAHKRGNDTEVITARFRLEGPPIGFDHASWLINNLNELVFHAKRLDLPIVFHPTNIIHAKLLLVDGETAVFGSHNMSDKGVKAGTREWSLFTTNQELVQNLTRFYQDLRSEIKAYQEKVV